MNMVYLHGHLADMFGEKWEFDIKTAREAIRALDANCKGFLAYLKRHSLPGYHIVVGDPTVAKDRAEDELGVGIGDQAVHIFPTFAGAKEQGWTNVIIGAVLVVAGAYLWATPVGQPMVSAGIGMMLGGVAALLTRPPSLTGPKEDKYENTPSYLFNGPINTQAQGHPVPVGYGMLRVGGAQISTSVVIEDFTPGTEDPNGFGFRITNLPNYSESSETEPVFFSIPLHATGGTAPYVFTLVSQAPGTYFTITESGGEYTLATDTALFGRYKVVVQCDDASTEGPVTKEIVLDARRKGGGGITPGEPNY